MLKRGLCWGAAFLVGFAGNAWSAGSAVRSRALPPLIPREVLFGNPEIMSVNLSPDGSWIAYLAPDQGVLNLWVRDLDGQAPARVLTQQRDRPQMPGYWTADGRFLISSRDGDGDENTVLVRIDPRTGESKDLTPPQGVKAVWIGADREAPKELLVALNDRDPRYHDTYVIDVETGERRLLYQSTDDGRDVSILWIDGAWNPVIRSQLLPDGGSAHELRLPGESEWRSFLQFNFEDTITGSGPGGFSRDGQWLYGVLSTGDDLPRLVRWSREQLETCGSDCTPEVVHRSSAGALGVALSDLDTGVPTALKEVDLRSRLVVLDPSVETDLARLRQLAGANDFAVVDQDLEGRRWLVAIGSDRQGPQYWLWEREQDEIRKLFSVQPKLDAYVLAPMESLDLLARDGRRLPAYLTRTPLASGTEPQPLVLLVHGGPQARDFWGFSSTHQLLANRGYHALSVNYRGSTGFGKEHLLAGEGEWYAAMQDDLVDAVRWAIDEGIADPDRIAIMGASYGGYAALAGLTRDPELFAAAIAEVGPSNLRTLIDSIPPYWESLRINFERMIGVGTVDLDAISPLQHVERIQRPLLLGHGANDPRVKLSESEAIAAAMAKRNLPIDFVVFPDEGHGFANPRNALAMTALQEAFLSEHLGGRAEPFGTTLNQSSMQWRLRSLPIP
ncbi:dipeptidyl aminopeptidase/peptidase S9 prolyl oligopeptidase [Synechococcus sp. A18-25c]|uniref:S9 family peptidase n=1 Tax=Synechococcus sp. A18-25c TaxID=1866938 RepID=UPI00185F342E|nr:S9 family peptidase [Synechococcus sp. A18-25c]QNJ21047.1 dipeptidyl aminopeptidase/peptidase S9 prolyl oligopeptidase [Synechococcus sp. A18-25c]